MSCSNRNVFNFNYRHLYHSKFSETSQRGYARTIITAEQQYYVDNNIYTANMGNLGFVDPDITANSGSQGSNDWISILINKPKSRAYLIFIYAAPIDNPPITWRILTFVSNKCGTHALLSVPIFDTLTGEILTMPSGDLSDFVLLQDFTEPLDDASFFYLQDTYCQSDMNPTPTITGLAGGVFTSVPEDLTINPSTGTIILLLSPVGEYVVYYETNGPNPNASAVSITIADC